MKLKYLLSIGILLSGVWSSCSDDLNQYPTVEATNKTVYTSVDGYKAVLAKLYASFVLAGQEKGGGDADLSSNTGYDYMRLYYTMQEVPTDEMAYTWVEGDNLYNLSYLNWDDNDIWVSDMYYRIYYTITMCNEFLRNATDDAIAGFPAADQVSIKEYRAEARFIRALAYYHALDLYGNVPYIDETKEIGSDYFPAQYSQRQMFDYIESELKAISPELPDPSATEYDHASKAADWALMAKLYLNGEVYTGESHYNDCVTYCDSIIHLNEFSLESDYHHLFNADNNLRTNEIIFSFGVDATNAVSWGSSTYLVCGSVSSSNSNENPADYGVNSGWGSFRAKSNLTGLFSDLSGSTDSRGRFFTEGQTKTVQDLTDESQGYLFEKWTNLTDGGQTASNTSSDGVDTDLPVFRLADIYLSYAEAVLRGATNGTSGQALAYVNDVRERAYGGSDGNITAEDMTLPFILNERGRELYLEATRRTDLIRFNKLTGSNYLWAFKGGVEDGSGVDSKYKLFPIPSTELTANPNISQNSGYSSK